MVKPLRSPVEAETISSSHVLSLGIKLFLSIFLPTASAIAFGLGALYQIQTSLIYREITEIERELIAEKSERLSEHFREVRADLLILSQQGELQPILDPQSDRPIVEQFQGALAQEYLIFAREKQVYDQIRALNLQGKEQVRVNLNRGQPTIISGNKLQNKSHRYWFHATLNLSEGEIFISPLDLNVEFGQIEQPLKPTIRFSTPVFDSSATMRGMVVVNYLADRFLQELSTHLSYSESMWLLNDRGYWLKSTQPEDEWGFMYEDERRNLTLAKTLPQTWAQINQAERGQFQTAEGLYTFTTIYPLQKWHKRDTYQWKLVTHVPTDILQSYSRETRNQLLLLFAALMGLTTIGSVFFVQAKLNHQQSDRQVKGLQNSMEDLYRNQAQLVQTEKMASLGQLVAGIAHEINNPVNFIHGNLIHAQKYFEDVVDLLKLYQSYYPQTDSEISDMAEDIELEFIKDDATQLFQSMHMGTERISEIVKSLRIFSRLDESETKEVNLHEGIDSTLTILQTRLRSNDWRPAIKVTKHYGNLPKIECYAGQLNQVFMNILSNAIDALEERDRERTFAQMEANPSAITIETRQKRDSIIIQISDNGLGINPAAQRRLFDPFFTTKPVGKGTGLGLAISYQVITEKHKGILSCSSEPGLTTFAIEIPLKSVNYP
ncbi:sensor histidine kinase [Roseofilum casamattae]|uniref:histidine kinase n=1 Tax=Roseofilum casamattae BLCC-M143 TaxID=3022442 RepID=A0ABT7C1I3_9CYAN|nr:ATP-binding protein [Roseofilum casamattae]MDJ1184551.1 ATP-binding protein [Roseofilum casamattae BLCC-M143]